MNFFLERMPIPYDVVHEFNKDGTLGNVIKVFPEADDPEQRMFVRYISSGVIMNLTVAKEIHSWLSECIKNVESSTGDENDDGDGNEE